MADPLPRYARVNPQNPEARAQCDRCGFCVYVARNKINGKCYVGSTKHFGNRKREHLRNAAKGSLACPYFYQAIRKYGEGSFEWDIVAHIETRKQLKRVETYWIKRLRPKYNVVNHGYGGNGGQFTAAGLRKIASISRGNNYRLGMTHSEETRERLRQAAITNLDKWKEYRKLGPESQRGKTFVWSEERKIAFRTSKQYQCKPVFCKDDQLLFASLQEASDHYKLEATRRQVNNGHWTIRNGWRWFGKRFGYVE